MVLNIAGTLDATGLRSVFNHPALQFVDGRTEWRGKIGVRNKMANLRFNSNLVGLGSTLPAPFTKAAGASLPLRLELRERPGRQRLLAIDLDKVASARLQLDSADPDGIKRGMISLGSRCFATCVRRVVDERQPRHGRRGYLAPICADGSGGTSIDLAGVDLQIGILDVDRRRFHDLKMEATQRTRHGRSRFPATKSPVSCRGHRLAMASLSARLYRFALPADHHPRGRRAGRLFRASACLPSIWWPTVSPTKERNWGA